MPKERLIQFFTENKNYSNMVSVRTTTKITKGKRKITQMRVNNHDNKCYLYLPSKYLNKNKNTNI